MCGSACRTGLIPLVRHHQASMQTAQANQWQTEPQAMTLQQPHAHTECKGHALPKRLPQLPPFSLPRTGNIIWCRVSSRSRKFQLQGSLACRVPDEDNVQGSSRVRHSSGIIRRFPFFFSSFLPPMFDLLSCSGADDLRWFPICAKTLSSSCRVSRVGWPVACS